MGRKLPCGKGKIKEKKPGSVKSPGLTAYDAIQYTASGKGRLAMALRVCPDRAGERVCPQKNPAAGLFQRF
jgi:hypothetical protein